MSLDPESLQNIKQSGSVQVHVIGAEIEADMFPAFVVSTSNHLQFVVFLLLIRKGNCMETHIWHKQHTCIFII